MSETASIRFEIVRLVSWDIDGTLYSIRQMKRQVLQRFCRELIGGRGSAAVKELKALRRFRRKIEAVRTRGGSLNEAPTQESRETLLQFEKRWYGEAIKRAGPQSGVSDLVMFLAERGLPQVALSDYQGAYKLDLLGLHNHFAAIYEGESFGFVKPSPMAFERISTDFAVPLENILHIGDRVDTDAASARAAGCQCLILGRDFKSFDSLLKRARAEFTLK